MSEGERPNAQPDQKADRDSNNSDPHTPPNVTVRMIDCDEMFKIHRIEHPGDVLEPPSLPFNDALVTHFIRIGMHFHAQGGPPLDGRVMVGDADGNGWAPISKEDEALMQDTWTDPRTECRVPSPRWNGREFRAERGLDFIRRRVEPGMLDYWLAEEAHTIRKVLDAPAAEAALWAAHALGELHVKSRHHGLNLPTLATGQKQRRNLDQNRATAIANGRRPMQRRREAVAAMLPGASLTGGALEGYLIRRLRDEHGIEAASRTVRNDLLELRRDITRGRSGKRRGCAHGGARDD